MHQSALPVRVLSRLSAEKRDPLDNEVCISITNPRQSPAALAGYAQILRLGFHDTDRRGGGFTPMSPDHAKELLSFCREYQSHPLMIHCEAGASRSVAVGLFVAAWLQRPLELEVDVLAPNPWVLQQLRWRALGPALRWRDRQLVKVVLRGPMAFRYAVLPVAIADTYLP